MGKITLCDEIENLEEQSRELTNQKREVETEICRLYLEIKDYTIFDMDLLGETLAKLIAEVSGREFVYGKVVNTYYKKNYIDESEEDYDPDHDFEYKKIDRDEHIVVAREKYKEKYYSEKSNSVEQLVDEGDAITLSWQNIFYKLDNMVQVFHCPNECFKFDVEKFDYVKEFINLLIQYCYENGIKSHGSIEKVTAAINICLKEFLENYEKEHTTNGPTLIKKGENK